MKRTPLKRKSKSLKKIITDKADRALQDYYRRHFAGHSCEGCGQPFELMHHYIKKSDSNNLRYDEDNLIFLCKICHSKIHCFGKGQLIEGRIVLKRGQEWLDRINKKSQIHVSYSPKDYQNFIDKYSL